MILKEEQKIFRKVSLERLSSPEQLDQLMQVTTPIGWVALLTIMMLILTALVWGLLGSIPTKVTGMGMLIKSGGSFNIISPGPGMVADLKAAEGDLVEAGEVVARIVKPELTIELTKARDKLRNLERQQTLISENRTESLRLQMENIQKQEDNINNTIKTKENQLKWLKDRIEVEEKLLQKGLITKQELINTKEKHNETELEIERYRSQFKQIAVDKLQFKTQKEQELLTIQQNINELKMVITGLEENIEVTTKVISPYTGRILEVKRDRGGIVNAGEPLFSLERVGKEVKELEAIVYVAAADGKKVKQGMKIQISPTTIKKEEYGSIKGMVTSVAVFPSTTVGMMRILNNEEVVKTLLGGGAPIEIYADLIIDEKTVSGYKWSSSSGPPVKVYSGTMCSADVIVSEQPPIGLVIPLFKKHLLGIGG